jgi:Flp pilus assembly protein TadB
MSVIHSAVPKCEDALIYRLQVCLNQSDSNKAKCSQTAYHYRYTRLNKAKDARPKTRGMRHSIRYELTVCYLDQGEANSVAHSLYIKLGVAATRVTLLIKIGYTLYCLLHKLQQTYKHTNEQFTTS